MKIPLFDLKRQAASLKNEVLEGWGAALDQTDFSYGSAIPEFEKSFSQWCSTSEAVALRSGTSSLLLTLMALGIGSGDEVVTTSMTFSATADAIALLGAKPIFADIEPLTGNLDPRSAEQVITSRTKAILVVHLYGVPAKMSEFVALAKKHHLFLIEDASHAHGSLYRGQPVGSFGIAGCFSLYPSKTLGAYGNAGIAVTSHRRLASKIRLLAHHGMSQKKYYHDTFGYNELIDNVQAVVLNLKMGHVDQWIKRRRTIALYYNDCFQSFGLQGMYWHEDTEPSLYVYSLQISQRRSLQAFLDKHGVGTGVYYPLPLHLQRSYKVFKYDRRLLKKTETFAKKTLSLPFFPELTDREIEYVATTVKKYFQHYARRKN